MKKEITIEEKLEFYEKYTSKDFQHQLISREDKFSKIGLNVIKIFFVICLVGLFFTPWMFVCAIPGFAVPAIMLAISHYINKKQIDKLTPNINYNDFIAMVESGEWKNLAQFKKNNTSKINELKDFHSKPTPTVSIEKEHQNNSDLSI